MKLILESLQKCFISLLLFWICPSICTGQDEGNFIQNFPPKSYRSDDFSASTQNWEIVQAENGLLYVANMGSMLVYDGQDWSTVQQTQNLGIKWLSSNKQGIIFAASAGDLGYIATDSLGRDHFFSLKKKLPEGVLSAESIQETVSWGGEIVFITENLLLIWNEETQSFEILSSPHRIEGACVSQNELYLWLSKRGLYKVSNNSFIAIQPSVEPFSADLSIKSFVSFQYPDSTRTPTFVLATTQGLFRIIDGELSLFSSSLVEAFPKLTVYDALQLKDYSLAIATHEAGVMILDSTGSIQYAINEGSGLQVNTVIRLFQDQQGDIWTGLESGVSLIQFPIRLQRWGQEEGITGTILRVLSMDDTIWLTTTTGLYRGQKEYPWATHIDFVKIPPIKEAWDILSYDGRIFIATNEGLYEWRESRLVLLVPNINCMGLYPSASHPDRIYVGTISGLAFLKKGRKGWNMVSQKIDLGHGVRSMAETTSGKLWGSWEGAASLVSINEDLSQNGPIQRFGSFVDNEEEFFSIEVCRVEDRIVFGTNLGIYEYEESSNKLQLKTASYATNLPETGEVYAVYLDSNQKFWLSSGQRENGWTSIDPDDQKVFASKPFTPINEFAWSFYTDKEGATWVGTENGLFRTQFPTPEVPKMDFQALIRKVNINEDSLQFGGTYDPNFPLPTGRNKSQNLPQISPHIQEINFSFSSNSFQYSNQTNYSYYLEGFEEDWSDWRKVYAKSYTGLWEGKYTFHVKAKDIYGRESEKASYAFEILPPWYRSTWAYVAYFFLLMAFLFALVKFFTRKQKQKLAAKELELQKEKETAERLRAVDKTQGRISGQYLS